MTHKEIVAATRKQLNFEGLPWNLNFEVSDRVQVDGAWLQIFIRSNSTRANAAAERQIIANVESELSEKSGQELLLMPVEELVA